MCMPQLQEGDEIVHINGRIVKELPHQEVLCFLWFIPSLLTPWSKYKFSLLLTIHFSTALPRLPRLYFSKHAKEKASANTKHEAMTMGSKQIEPIEAYCFIFVVPTYYSTAFCWYLTAFLGVLLLLRFIRPFVRPVTWYKISHDAVYTVTRTSPAQLSFVLKVPLCNFRPGRTNSLLFGWEFLTSQQQI